MSLSMESPEHERRHIAEYVELEAGDETVTHAEKIASERVMGHTYDVWDVQTDKNRWWVITNITNLYLQNEFKSMDYVLSFHIGLMHRMMARQSQEPRTGDEERDRLLIPWRKWEQAGKAAEEADEAEDFQAVGMRCREALLAFVRAAANDEMVPQGNEIPKKGDFLHWSEHIAAAITPKSPRLRGYLRKTAAHTWDLVNWLTHEANAHRFDAIIAVDATAHTLDVYGMALVRHERGQPERCPECGSYRLASDYRTELDVYVTLCEACDWESEPRDADALVSKTSDATSAPKRS
jgi:hypothetical protein